jgi:hypothetical protein
MATEPKAADVLIQIFVAYLQTDVDGADIAGARQHVGHRQRRIPAVIVNDATEQIDTSIAAINHRLGPQMRSLERGRKRDHFIYRPWFKGR